MVSVFEMGWSGNGVLTTTCAGGAACVGNNCSTGVVGVGEARGVALAKMDACGMVFELLNTSGGCVGVASEG